MMLLASGMLAASALGLPRYAPGDAYVFSDGHVEQVRSLKDGAVVWSGLNDITYTRARNPVVPIRQWTFRGGEGRREVFGTPDALWPLDRPRSVRFRVVTHTRTARKEAWERQVVLWTCRSGKARTLDVRAGRFVAVPLTCDRYSPTSMKLIERISWDYAPELGHYVRRASINYARATSRTIELTAALAAPASTPARLEALARAARAGARQSTARRG